MKKQNLFSSLVIVAVVLFAACSKDKVSPSQSVLNITANQSVLKIVGINDSKSQIVNVKLKSMEQQTFPIECYNQSSEIFNAKNKTFGYQDCNKIYRIMDIETGVELKQIPLPVFIADAEMDTIRNVIIGWYCIGDKSYVLTVDLNNGTISDNPFGNDGDKWHTCFFRDVENEYVWLRSDSVLVFINPTKGNTIRTLQLDVAVEGGIYDRKNNRLIGISSVSTARLCCLQ